MPADRDEAAHTGAGVGKPPGERTRGIGSRPGPQVLWGLYERGHCQAPLLGLSLSSILLCC